MNYLESAAILSADGLCRFVLRRVWDPELPRALLCGLNPSTADGYADDPTIRREVDFAKSWSCGSLEKVNIYPYRATNPADLVAAFKRGVDVERREENLDTIRGAMGRATIIVAAWGAHPMQQRGIRDEVLKVLCDARGVYSLGQNKDGSPKHPLYLPKSAKRELTWTLPISAPSVKP